MKKAILLISFVIGGALLTCFYPQFSLADQNPLNSSEQMIQEGEGFLQEKDYISATHTFTKILMFDPDNQRAREYLDLLQKGYYQSHRISKSIPAKKTDHKEIRVLKKKVARLEKGIIEQKNIINQKNEALKALESQFSSLANRFETAQRNWQDEKISFAQEVIDLQGELSDFQKKRASLNDKIALLQTENDQLRTKIIVAQRDGRMQSALEQTLLKNLKNVVLQKDHEIAKLKKEFAQTNRYSDTALALLAQKNKELALLDTGVKKLQDRLTTEKRAWAHQKNQYDNKLASLNKTVTLSQKTIASINNNRDRQIQKTQNILTKNQNVLTKTRQALTRTQHQLETAQTNLMNRSKTIDELNDQLAKFETRSLKFRHTQTKNSKNYEDLFQEYTLTVSSLKNKDSLIAHLKGELANARRDLASLEKDIDQSRNKEFLALKQHLKDIQTKIEKQLSEKTSRVN